MNTDPCVHTYIYIYVYIYMLICAYICTHSNKHTEIPDVYIYICIGTSVPVYDLMIWVYTGGYVCMHARLDI